MVEFKNYELDATGRKYAEIKHKQRLALRAEYWKKMSNPALQASAEGGHLFDPAMYRMHAARLHYTEHFKATGKTIFWGFASLVAPIALAYKLVLRDRENREAMLRNGEVAYTDREFKYV